MRALVGDRVIVTTYGGERREGKILEVRRGDGEPPWLVRWNGSKREVIYFPGPDAAVEHEDAWQRVGA